jgi:hypothetical protein
VDRGFHVLLDPAELDAVAVEDLRELRREVSPWKAGYIENRPCPS